MEESCSVAKMREAAEGEEGERWVKRVRERFCFRRGNHTIDGTAQA